MPLFQDMQLTDAIANTQLWRDKTAAWTTGPDGMLGSGSVYVQGYQERTDVCPHGGGAAFTVNKPAILSVCCQNNLGPGTINQPEGSDWEPLDGEYALTDLQGTPCSFFRKQILVGDTRVCCNSGWASGAIVEESFQGAIAAPINIDTLGVDQDVVVGIENTPVWKGSAVAFSSAPAGVFTNQYVRASQGTEVCPKGGGSTFGIDQPAHAYVCCNNKVSENNPPEGNDWFAALGSYGLTGQDQQDPCTFYYTSLGSGDHTVCCTASWASGVFLIAEAPAYQLASFTGDGVSAAPTINLGNPDELKITGDLTIATWIKIVLSNGEMTWLAKCDGGEFEVSVEADGRLKYSYGTAGTRAEPRQSIKSLKALQQNRWYHIAIVRNFKEMKLRWYIDGALDKESPATFNFAKASNLDVTIGKDYNGDLFHGDLQNLLIYNRALPKEDIEEVKMENAPVAMYSLHEFYGDGTSEYPSIIVGNKPGLRVIGDLTISFWIKPSKLMGSEKVIGKARQASTISRSTRMVS
jgi:hypothetical protein